MDPPSNQSKSAAASDLEARLLQRELDTRRQDLGYVEGVEAKKITSTPAMSTPKKPVDEQAEAALAANRLRHERWKALVDAAGDLYAGCTFDNFTTSTPYQKKVLLAVREYAAEIRIRFERRESLLLYGPVGTGKDHLAMGVMRAAIGADMTVRWLYVQDWFGDVRDAMDNETNEADMIRRLVNPDWLVLSDPVPPIEGLTKHQATMLYRVVKERYARRRPTITTVNVANDDEADSKLGTATWDRLSASAWKIFCNWDTHRKPVMDIRA